MSLFRFLKNTLAFLYLRYYGVECRFGKIKLYGFPIIRCHHNSRIIFEDNITLNSSIRSNPAGIISPCVISTIAEGAIIRIGSGSGISGAVICASEKIEIGKSVGIGAGAKIYDTDFHPVELSKRIEQNSIMDAGHAPVTICDYAWLGAEVMILKGVTIGRASVIAARSLVVDNIPENILAAGVPAKEVKKINC